MRLLIVLCALSVCAFGAMRNDTENRFRRCDKVESNIYGYEVETLTGERHNLTKYRGKVLLIVNVATFCGKQLPSRDANFKKKTF